MGLRWIALACAVALTGCGAVPSSGPSVQYITDETPKDAAPKPYVVVRLDPRSANIAGEYDPPGFSSFYKVDFGEVQVRLAVGDTINVNIFEAGADGLFSSSTQKATQITAVIDEDGQIFVPYVGTIQAAGRSAKSLRTAIENALQDKAIQPQVQVQVGESIANSVTIIGEVGSTTGGTGGGGGTVPITTSNFRLLDVIAAAGGTTAPSYETRIILRRGNKVASANLEDVFDDPKENVTVQPGDTILVATTPETYTVFGAATTKSEVKFETRRVTLAEGLARAGGLNDALADARGVFLFRFEPAAIAKKLSERAVGAQDESMVPVVYQLNLKDPNSFFLMQTFQLRDEDVLYIATHPSVEFNKFLTIIEPAVSQAITALTLSQRFSN